MSSTTVINTQESEFEHAKELVRGAPPAKQQEAVRIFEKLAAQGHSEACYMLGCLAERFSWCYTAPDQGQKDIDLETYWFTKAFELFKKEAENGNLKSQTHLAEMYACGCGTKKDSDKAAYWQKIVFAEYLRRAEAGDAEKQLAVAEMYKKGCITEQDFEKAAFWYEKVSEHADAETLSDIASEYLNGYMGTSEKNIQRVEALLRRCADTADAQLLHEIGMNFIHSAIYRPVGFKLLQKSADMGCQESKVSLARLYLMQHETSPEICKMRETLDEALSSGTISQYHVKVEFQSLGRYYHDKAEYYLDMAQYGYNCDAALRIALRLLSWEPYNPAEEVFSILKEIASISNINRSLAEFILGCLYDKGLGTEKDETAAAEWFIRAAEHDYYHAKLVAGAIYLKGIGVEKDSEKAEYWLKKISGMDGTMKYGDYLIPKPYLPQIFDYPEETITYGAWVDMLLSIEKYVDVVLPWFIQEADNGNAAAQLGIGIKLLYGRYEESSFTDKIERKESGLEYLRKAADQNYAPAQYRYGYYYLKRDKDKALEYMHKSADNGYQNALNFLENQRFADNVVLKTMKRYNSPRDFFNIEGSEFHIPCRYIEKGFEE